MEREISLLSGDALLRAYIEMVYPNAFSLGSGPIVAIKDDGTVKVFAEGEEKPKIEVVTKAEQLVYAMTQLQSANARFQAAPESTMVFCTIDNSVAMASNHFEAGMKSQILSFFQRH